MIDCVDNLNNPSLYGANLLTLARHVSCHSEGFIYSVQKKLT